MEQLYASQSQPVCKATLCVARDRVKVQSRRKHVFTDQIDQLIQEKDVRRFIFEHPTDIDLRKVDQSWFLDLITNGLVRAA